MSKISLLKLTDVSKSFKGLETPVLDKINFLISSGENVAITGVSGSGKSTLLHLMAGLEKPDDGKIQLWDYPINNLSQNKISSIRNKHLVLFINFIIFFQIFLQLKIPLCHL